MVVWDRVDYIKEAQKQLKDENVYKKVNFKDQNLSELVDKSNHFFRGLKTKGCITDKNLKYFTYQYKKACNLGKLYLLPKIHKRLSEVPGRPVISNCGAPTEKVSEFLDFHLKSIMQEGASYIKDTADFQDKIKNLRVPKDAFLVTADVVGLYPNIPHEAGLKSLKEALDRRREKKISTEDLVKMAEFVLKNNYFEFDRSVYQQVSGTAIATKFAPPYACIFMDRLENSFLETQSLKPLVWLRYIDDIFFIWTHSEEELKEFMRELNSFDTNIKFTYEYSDKKVSFLDLQVDIVEGKLITSLFVKPTDRHQYLHYSSCHPEHTKRSIIYSQTLRLKRLCSLEKDFKEKLSEMKSWFLKRGYPERIIDYEIEKVNFRENKKKSGINKRKGVPFVVTYHPKLKNLSKIIKDNLYLLYMNDEVKKTFTPSPMISFRSSRKISSYIVRAKLYPLERTVGSSKCGKKRCEVCDVISETDTFSSTVTGESFKINHKFNCNDKCLVYLATCKICNKQYTGQTTDSFRSRWNNYKSKSRKFDRNEKCMQEYLYSHFASEGHNGFLEDVSIALIDKTDGSDPTKRETFWMHTLKTLAPYGLNVEDGIENIRAMSR